MGIGQRNINSHRPTSVGATVCLILSYLPCCIAMALILAHVYAYYSGFVGGILVEAAQGYPNSMAVRSAAAARSAIDSSDTAVVQLFGKMKNKMQVQPAFNPPESNIATARTLLYVYVPVGTLMFALVIIAYLRTVFTAPGYVTTEPWSRMPTVITDGMPIPCDHTHFVSLVSSKGEIRHCRKCNVYKPDDSHHCSQCERCIHRMDHHCPWVNNCVGRNNTKYFIQFLLYISAGSAVIVAQIISSYSILHMEFSLTSLASHITVMMLIIGCSCFALFLGCFGGAQLYMVYSGDSTLGRVHDHLKGRDHFYDVFGRPSHWVYHLLPTAPARPRWAHDAASVRGDCLV